MLFKLKDLNEESVIYNVFVLGSTVHIFNDDYSRHLQTKNFINFFDYDYFVFCLENSEVFYEEDFVYNNTAKIFKDDCGVYKFVF